jgi:hypothetical protein
MSDKKIATKTMQGFKIDFYPGTKDKKYKAIIYIDKDKKKTI